MNIKDNIKAFKDKLKNTDCKLIAVSKTKPVKVINEAFESGQIDFGENRVQELEKKVQQLPDGVRWHMIGHLQTNKVKSIAAFIHLIHSVDRLKLLREINKQGAIWNRVILCLLQVHIAREESKFGFSEQEILDLLGSNDLEDLSFIRIIGLMGMATNTPNMDIVRNEFAALKQFLEKLKSLKNPTNVEMSELSIGMTSDYQIAMEEGSTMVRIGSAIFGPRDNKTV